MSNEKYIAHIRLPAAVPALAFDVGGAAETGAASAQVLSSAQSLASEGSRLKFELGKFLATVRAA